MYKSMPNLEMVPGVFEIEQFKMVPALFEIDGSKCPSYRYTQNIKAFCKYPGYLRPRKGGGGLA